MGFFDKINDTNQYLLSKAQRMNPYQLCDAIKKSMGILYIVDFNCYLKVLSEKAKDLEYDELIEVYEYAERNRISAAMNALSPFSNQQESE